VQLRFDNTFANELPADPDATNRRRQVQGACYSRVQPTKVTAPHLIAHSREVLELLGLTEADVRSQSFVDVFSGNHLLDEMAPLAACYGGHQFGNWAGQLGDGRAISLGEVIDRHGGRQELQLKGAGPTPYSRMGDGRAVLRSSLREFLCSEAMFHLGIATTRALCLVGTGDLIERDLLYDGHPRLEPGAIVCRVAPSFLRFGNFQLFASRDDHATLRTLAKYTLKHHFPEFFPKTGEPSKENYAAWFHEVCRRTAIMVAHWMRVGFVHGVLNTDNMSVLGLTIDYGPYGWLDDFDPNWTPNTTDRGGKRYRFGHQPRVAGWNLARFAESLLPLVNEVEPLEQGLEIYQSQFERSFRQMQCQKLGFRLDADVGLVADSPFELAEDLERLLSAAETDMTLFYRALATLDLEGNAIFTESAAIPESLLSAYYSPPEDAVRASLLAWLRRYAHRVASESWPERRVVMDGANPKFVLRNYMAQVAIDAAESGDYSPISELLDVLRRPYDEQPTREQWATKRPDWARSRPGCSMLSCSS
jgi:uncharacterized protein YdiU (UPF0061 family)